MMVENGSSNAKLISVVNVAWLNMLHLPPPNRNNTGGYFLPPNGTPCYSPIDTAIVVLTKLWAKDFEPVTDLSKWFIQHRTPYGASLVHINILNGDSLITNTVLGLSILYPELIRINAPFYSRENLI